jgi:hypothetical protein
VVRAGCPLKGVACRLGSSIVKTASPFEKKDTGHREVWILVGIVALGGRSTSDSDSDSTRHPRGTRCVRVAVTRAQRGFFQFRRKPEHCRRVRSAASSSSGVSLSTAAGCFRPLACQSRQAGRPGAWQTATGSPRSPSDP